MGAKNGEINLYEAAKTLGVNTNKTSDTSLVKPIQKNTLQKKIRRKSHNKLKDLNQELESTLSERELRIVRHIADSTLKGDETKKHALRAFINYKKMPEERRESIKILCDINKVPYHLMGGVGIKESKFEVGAKSEKLAEGIFQIIPSTEQGLLDHMNGKSKKGGAEQKYFSKIAKNEIFMKEYNKYPKDALSIAYLGYLLKEKGSVVAALDYYNSGGKDGGKETQDYISGDKSVEEYAKFFNWCLANNLIS